VQMCPRIVADATRQCLGEALSKRRFDGKRQMAVSIQLCQKSLVHSTAVSRVTQHSARCLWPRRIWGSFEFNEHPLTRVVVEQLVDCRDGQFLDSALGHSYYLCKDATRILLRLRRDAMVHPANAQEVQYLTCCFQVEAQV
jgi:hypothetical protein